MFRPLIVVICREVFFEGYITQIQEDLAEGYNKGWPKHVAGYAVRNAII